MGRVVPALPDGLLPAPIVATVAPDGWTAAGLVNDFEPSVMGKCHEIARVKAAMEELNPVYCAMTGSGSAVFGLFEHDDADKLSACLRSVFPGCDTFAAPLLAD